LEKRAAGGRRIPADDDDDDDDDLTFGVSKEFLLTQTPSYRKPSAPRPATVG
jgi:hypothetical protein